MQTDRYTKIRLQLPIYKGYSLDEINLVMQAFIIKCLLVSSNKITENDLEVDRQTMALSICISIIKDISTQYNTTLILPYCDEESNSITENCDIQTSTVRKW